MLKNGVSLSIVLSLRTTVASIEGGSGIIEGCLIILIALARLDSDQHSGVLCCSSIDLALPDTIASRTVCSWVVFLV